MGYATSLPMLYVLYCLAGVGAAFVYSGSIGSALKWFKEKRGLASGIMAAGFGGGTALFIPVIQSMLRDSGYQQTFLMTGIFQGVVIAVVAQFLRHPAAEAPAAGQASSKAAAVVKKQFTTLEVLKTPQFYVMYIAFVLMATGGLLVTANAGPMARSWGFASVLTLAATLSPIANGAARVFWGWASDRLGRENTMIFTFVMQSLCLVAVATLGQASGAWFVATLVAVYFTWGQVYSLFPSMSGDYFGTTHATSNYAVLYTAKGVASIIGGWVGALLYEQSGSWAMGFYGSAIMALIAAVLVYGLRASQATAKAKASKIAVPA
jgi:OFA family oxalate/formate antiporter-like MFS transporter